VKLYLAFNDIYAEGQDPRVIKMIEPVRVPKIKIPGQRSSLPASGIKHRGVPESISSISDVNLRKQISGIIPLSPVGIARTCASIISAENIAELNKLITMHLERHFDAKVNFETHPNIANRAILLGRGIATVPLLDAEENILGAIRIETDYGLTNERIDIIREFSKVINKAYNAITEKAQLKEKEEKIQQLQELAVRDPLTALYNRRYFMETIKREIAISKRDKTSLSLLMIDIDHFKSINDTHGHQAGDEVLRTISKIIKGAIRDSDLAARYGGEEIVLILPRTDLNGALKLAEKTRKLIEAAIIIHNGKQIKVTASFGAAQYFPGMGSENKLIEAADKNLYEAKETGRNKVIPKID